MDEQQPSFPAPLRDVAFEELVNATKVLLSFARQRNDVGAASEAQLLVDAANIVRSEMNGRIDGKDRR